MPTIALVPELSDIIAGEAVFKDDMPVWLGSFGSDIWPFVEPTSPLYEGESSSSFVWRDLIEGKGASLNHPSSYAMSRYEYCLTREIVHDLKIAAVIHGYFPKLIKHARSSKEQLDPKTVKNRIDELAKFFSLAIKEGQRKLNVSITQLSQVPFSLVKDIIATFPGRAEHLRRALKLISDPMVQKNLSAPLQWGILDIEKSSIAWGESKDEGGIPTLSDTQFLFLLDQCKKRIARFKSVAGMAVHDSECDCLARSFSSQSHGIAASGLDAYYKVKPHTASETAFSTRHGVTLSEMRDIIREGHLSALLLVLLFTGMRASEIVFLKRDCLSLQHGYWFLNSKEVKQRPKDVPISEGWLAIDITRDAYDILMFITERTGNEYLFSSPFRGYEAETGYSSNSLNTKFSRWFKEIDVKGLFADWSFSIHQCRETLVAQLAAQEVGMTFISMQLKHFHSQFNAMPNAVTAGYGKYRKQLMTSVANRLAEAREIALVDLYGEHAKFAGGGGATHKARIDAFFAGLGLFGEQREQYIKDMARRGVKLMPTSIGNCGKNFAIPTEDTPPPCYGDFQCDPNCSSHVITQRAGKALVARKQHALAEAERETNPGYKKVWWGMVQALDGHLAKLELESSDG